MTPKAIRDDIIARLTGNTTALENVSSSVIAPHMLSDLPAIAVYTPQRIGENIEHNSLTFKKFTQCEINCIVGNLLTYADDLDELLEQVKELLFSDETWYSQFDGLIENYQEDITLNDEGDTFFATGVLTFIVQNNFEFGN